MKSIIIHYGEIGLKRDNRAFFEKMLMNQIASKTGFRPRKQYGSLVINDVQEEIVTQLIRDLKEIPGIKYIAVALESGLKVEDFIDNVAKIIDKEKTFKIVTKRSNKSFPKTSPEINRIIGQYFVDRGHKVDVHDPKQKIYVEIIGNKAFIYAEKIQGIGGLPVGTAGKLLSLVSGGIDSPVATYLMIKRGCTVNCIHFHNERSGPPEKIHALLKILTKFQPRFSLFVIPFNNIQNQIIRSVPRDLRMIIYRRLMFLIANRIGFKQKAKGLVTGDNVGQVASQTLDNLLAIRDSSRLPVYSPLIGMDKEEIIAIAKKIGTYETSIQQYDDCCSYLIAKHPETKTKLRYLIDFEEKLDMPELIEQGLTLAKKATIER
ncbi:MAG: tRNA uracil 4-sulfurtransferase ThiI [Candidatus Helarchaeota archaeon]